MEYPTGTEKICELERHHYSKVNHHDLMFIIYKRSTASRAMLNNQRVDWKTNAFYCG